MGRFTTATLEQIRAASDIVEVVGSYLPLKRAGASFVALCPFHKEKTPSFHVNPQRQTFHCFGCHKGGSVFTFVKEFENIDFVEAVRRLADRAKIPLDFDQSPSERHSRTLKETLLTIHEQITQRWQNALANEASGQLAREYLSKRRVSQEAIQLFRLGAAPEAWDDTVNWAKSKGFDLALVEQAGLIIRKEGTDRHYDRFRGRLMFPISDEQGRVIGFSGRILSGEEKTAKYVNSPETPIFTKSKVFFGLHKSKRALLDAGCAIVCEGQLDLITCFMSGVENVVAPQGTALTADHTRILKRYVSEVVLCFDSDEAGQKAAVRALDHLLESGLTARVAVVPAPHDPDSFIHASGAAAFKELIAKAEAFFDYLLNRLCSRHDVATDKGKVEVLTAMGTALHKTGNAVLIDSYARKTALRLAVSPAAVQTEFRKLAGKHTARPPQAFGEEDAQGPAPETVSKPGTNEFWLLKLLLLHDELLDWAHANLSLEWIQHPEVRGIAAARFQAHQDGTWQGLPALLEALENSAAQSIVSEAVTQDRPLQEPAKQLADVATRLRNQHIDVLIAESLRMATQPGVSEEQQVALLKHQQELRAGKRKPLTP